jgi:nitrate/TMAO reductase-like tetraheme cytochrome c subunit
MRSFLVAMTRNPLSLLGTAITTASAVLIVALLAIEYLGFHGNPYVGILSFLVLPAFFVVGLVLIPIGILRERRRARLAEERGEAPPEFPVIDLNLGRTRRLILVLLVLTAVNVVILAAATYKGVEVMDSTEFCGTACHSVMHPEYTAYVRSPHARVKCVSCHIGPGADWFVKSKLSGAWQVIATTFDLYPRPIPVPIRNLRPARETCEQCHWPTKFVGDRLKVVTHFDNDAENTELKTVLLLRVGGIQGRVGQGIHWHVDPNLRIRYRSDLTREKIYDVEMTLADGTVKTYTIEDAPPEEEGEDGTPMEWRLMDCVDCHNRPTHIYNMPGEAVDEAIRIGGIDRSLPYIRREGIRALKEEYESHDEARRGITEAILSFYGDSYPDLAAGNRAEIEEAARRLGEIYATNVFPAMRVGWGTYPDHIGHVEFEGCFRCHDDEHATEAGETISQDCDTCHSLLAMEEEDPEILEQLQP